MSLEFPDFEKNTQPSVHHPEKYWGIQASPLSI
jgi:hypothetical protein